MSLVIMTVRNPEGSQKKPEGQGSFRERPPLLRFPFSYKWLSISELKFSLFFTMILQIIIPYLVLIVVVMYFIQFSLI